MNVKEIMSSNVEWASPELSLQAAAKKMRDIGIGSLPVREKADGKLIGMITDRDMACRAVAEGCDPAKTKVGDIMSMGTTHCFEDQDVSEAATIMEANRLQRLPVLNQDKDVVGLLSIADLATHVSHELSGEVLEAVSKQTH
jgi:CBS domain-containing protein